MVKIIIDNKEIGKDKRVEIELDNYEKIADNFKEKRFGGGVKLDETDHLYFICPKCKEILKVTKVQTDWSGGDCTWVFLACNKCQIRTYKKFYWN